MKSKIRNLIQICCLALALIFAVLLTTGPSIPTSLVTYAKTGSNAELFDQTNVLDDLEGFRKDNQAFSLETYPFDQSRDTELLGFVEFCYSYADSLLGDYGLYLYIYNPKGLEFDVKSELNKINLRAGSDVSKPFHKYRLEFLNKSERADYAGLFYKFKVNLSSEQRRDILDSLNSTKREYRISEIELLVKGGKNAAKILVGTSYYFSGYAQGYGPSDVGNTLSIESETKDTLSLTPQFTYFRPNGSNGKNIYTSDSLHTAYFAVPNAFIKKYGEMSEIHAEWLDAVLAPSLVTGNKDAYNAIKPYLGKNIGSHTDSIPYVYLGAYDKGILIPSDDNYIQYGYSYNLDPLDDDIPILVHFDQTRFGEKIQTLSLMIYSGEGTDSADNYVVTANMLKDKLKSATADLGGELVNEKYSKILFSEISEEFTDVNISRETKYSLEQEVVGKEWWQKLFGLEAGVISKTPFDGIQAIEAVTPEKMNGNEIDVCNRLYINRSDYQDFKQYYEKYKDDYTVYLFRYQVSDYISQEATLCKFGLWQLSFSIDTNAYFFQETTNLDFDIIDVTFSDGVHSEAIPVAMSPSDFIPGADPPLYTESDENNDWLQNLLEKIFRIALAIVLTVLIVVAIYKVVQLIILSKAVDKSEKSDRSDKDGS